MSIELGLGTAGVAEAPLAVQGKPPGSGLFSTGKKSMKPNNDRCPSRPREFLCYGNTLLLGDWTFSHANLSPR
jgi:hypothetical protein